MVFVVSFSSCLDVAAISMDMGEALDVNNELMTVGISNCKRVGLSSVSRNCMIINLLLGDKGLIVQSADNFSHLKFYFSCSKNIVIMLFHFSQRVKK